MSDGDNATPGRPRRPDRPGGDNQWLTRTPRPTPGAAPWERRSSAEPDDTDTAGPTGNHTDGVTVADLIAKVTGRGPTRTAPSGPTRDRHRSAPSRTAPPIADAAAPTARRVTGRTAAGDPTTRGDPDTEVIPSASLTPSELPDLSALRRRQAARTAAVGDAAGAARPEPHRGRRTAMVVGTRRRRPDRGAGAGADRRGVAVAVGEEQHAQQGLGAGPRLARHPRPQRAVR